MSKICKVTINGEPFLANRGELLLDWALMSGIDLPHDCRSGICGACRVRLVDGQVFGGHSRGDDMIHACQARIVSDLEIAIEAAPEPVTSNCRSRSTTFPASIANCSFRDSRQGPTARLFRWKALPTITCCTFTSEWLRMDWYPRRSAAKSAPGTASS